MSETVEYRRCESSCMKLGGSIVLWFPAKISGEDARHLAEVMPLWIKAIQRIAEANDSPKEAA